MGSILKNLGPKIGQIFAGHRCMLDHDDLIDFDRIVWKYSADYFWFVYTTYVALNLLLVLLYYWSHLDRL